MSSSLEIDARIAIVAGTLDLQFGFITPGIGLSTPRAR
jgi:hypothetical protein